MLTEGTIKCGVDLVRRGDREDRETVHVTNLERDCRVQGLKDKSRSARVHETQDGSNIIWEHRRALVQEDASIPMRTRNTATAYHRERNTPLEVVLSVSDSDPGGDVAERMENEPGVSPRATLPKRLKPLQACSTVDAGHPQSLGLVRAGLEVERKWLDVCHCEFPPLPNEADVSASAQALPGWTHATQFRSLSVCPKKLITPPIHNRLALDNLEAT